MKIETYNDLYDLNSIGTVIGSAYFSRFDLDKKLNKKEVATEIQLLKMLDSERVDAIVGTGCQVDYEIKRLELQKEIIKASYSPESNVDLYIAFSKKSNKKYLMEEINKLLLELAEDKEIEKIGKKYF